MVKFGFSYAKLRNQPFFAEIFKTQSGAKANLCPCDANETATYFLKNAESSVIFAPSLWRKVLRSEIPSGKCAKLRTVAASNNRDHPTRSLYYCLFAPHIYVCSSRNPVRGESHNQRNATGEVATQGINYWRNLQRACCLLILFDFGPC